MSDFGIKISKPGFDVKTTLTEANKKNFQLLDNTGCLILEDTSASPSSTNVFLGYSLDNNDTECHPLNYQFGDFVYLIYANKLDD